MKWHHHEWDHWPYKTDTEDIWRYSAKCLCASWEESLQYRLNWVAPYSWALGPLEL
jgi:hypothetical protein